MMKISRLVTLNGSEIHLKLSLLTNELVIFKDKIPLAKKLLWKPFQKIYFNVDDKKYTLKVTLFPINSAKLFDGKNCILKEVFPRYRALSLLSFGVGLLKKLVMIVALVFS